MLNIAYADRLVRRIKSVHKLDPDDEAALRSLPMRVAEIGAREEIVSEGDRPTRCCIIFEGLSCWYKTTGDGARQILSLQIAGDIPDLHSVHLEVMDSSLLTLAPCTVGFLDHGAVREITRKHPQIASAFWRMTLIDGAIFREWVTNVGSRKGPARIAHLFCEQVTRLLAVGLVDSSFRCALPMTQGDIAAAVGLSTVHVNRALQGLRRRRLITYEKATLTVHDWEGLQEAGDFDPTYLFLTSPGQAPVPSSCG